MDHDRTLPVTFRDVAAAAERIQHCVLRTPTVESPSLSPDGRSRVFLKCENMQYVGAFKARGACNAVLSLSSEEAARGVVTHSSGNHAAALARAAALRGIPAFIVMPRNSAPVKLNAVRRMGIEPVLCDPDSDSRQQTADQVAASTGAVFIHPFDNPHIIAGQGTSAMEMLQDVADLDALIVPVGGGGLLSGTLLVAKEFNPHLKVYAAEPQLADDAWRSLRSGRVESPVRYDTIADGLRTSLGRLTFPVIRELVHDVLLVSEAGIKEATRRLLLDARLTAEPSGAVPLAALYEHFDRFRGLRTGLIVSGGNPDPGFLREVIGS